MSLTSLMAVWSPPPPTPSINTVSNTDVFMLPDVIGDVEEFEVVVNVWFREMEAEEPPTRSDNTTHSAPLSSIFGSALAPLTDANVNTV